MRAIIRILLQLIEPPRCVLCDSLHTLAPVCQECLHNELITYHAEHRCEICFTALFERGICESCKIQQGTFFRQRALWDFRPAVRDLIHEMKFKHNAALCYHIGAYFAPQVLEYFDGTEWDYIVPVPLHRKRIFERGYNQCDFICSGITRALLGRTHTKAERTVLERVRDTPKQSLVRHGKRKQNLINAFRCRMNLSGKKVLLVDDVYTTGATAENAAAALMKAGAIHIDLFTLARSDGGL